MKEFLVDLIEELIFSGIDEDSHFRFQGFNLENSMDKQMSEKILNYISDIDKMDLLMNELRPVIIEALKQVSEDYKIKL